MGPIKGMNEEPGGLKSGGTNSSVDTVSVLSTSVAGKSSNIETDLSNVHRDEDTKNTESSRIQDTGISSSASQGVQGTYTCTEPGTQATLTDDSGRTQVPTALCVEKTLKEESLKLPSKKKGAPSERDRSTLRKGKWTVEEEEYTSRIIHFFNSGLLTLPEGYTLRSYLAEKLNCDPMRITKKYAGAACLGRRAYHYRDRPQPTITEIQLAKAQLDELEHRFRMRVEDGYTGNPPPSTLDVLASLQQRAGNPVLSLSMQQQQSQQQQITSAVAIQSLLLSILGASLEAATQPPLSIPAPPPIATWPNGGSLLQAATPAPSTDLPTTSAPMGQIILSQTGAPPVSAPAAQAPSILLPAAQGPNVPFPMAQATVISSPNMSVQNTQAPALLTQNTQAPAMPTQLTQAPSMLAQTSQSSSFAVPLQPQIISQAQNLNPSLLSRLELAVSPGNVGPSSAAMHIATAAPAASQQQQMAHTPLESLAARPKQQPFEAPLATLNSQQTEDVSQHADELRRAFEQQARAKRIDLHGSVSASASGGGLLETLVKKPPEAKTMAASRQKRSRTDEDKAAGSILLGFLSSLRESYLDAVNEKQKQEQEEGQSNSSGTLSSSNLQGHTTLPGAIPMRIATVTDSASSQQGSVEDYDWSSERKSDSSEESDKEVQVKEQRRAPPRKRHKIMIPTSQKN